MEKKYIGSVHFKDRYGMSSIENRTYGTDDLEYIEYEFRKIYPEEFWEIISIETQLPIEEDDPESIKELT